MDGASGKGGERKNAQKVLMGKTEGKSSLGRTKYKWENNVQMCLKGIGWEGVDWINIDQDVEIGSLL